MASDLKTLTVRQLIDEVLSRLDQDAEVYAVWDSIKWPIVSERVYVEWKTGAVIFDFDGGTMKDELTGVHNTEGFDCWCGEIHPVI